MHYFVRDHKAREESKPLFMQKGRWWLVASLLGGYLVGYWTQIPNTVIAIAVSFLAGGILLNVLHYELPPKKEPGYGYFVLGALLYTFILLTVGV